MAKPTTLYDGLFSSRASGGTGSAGSWIARWRACASSISSDSSAVNPSGCAAASHHANHVAYLPHFPALANQQAGPLFAARVSILVPTLVSTQVPRQPGQIAGPSGFDGLLDDVVLHLGGTLAAPLQKLIYTQTGHPHGI